MTSPCALVGATPPGASQSDVALPLHHIELHRANEDHSTQCTFILAPIGGMVKALPGERRVRCRPPGLVLPRSVHRDGGGSGGPPVVTLTSVAQEMEDGVVGAEAEAARMLVASLSEMVLQHASSGDTIRSGEPVE
jgi:hypothetical protein